MASTDVLFRVRIHDGDPTTLATFEAGTGGNLITVTSERGGTLPYIEAEPRGDGQSFDPVKGKAVAGSYSIRVIDAFGTTAIETVAWQEDFGNYADTAALLAVWNVETDPEGIGTWSLDATHVFNSTKALRNVISGNVSSPPAVVNLERTVTGLAANTDYNLYRSIYPTGDAIPGFTLDQWNHLAKSVVTTDGSGNVQVVVGGSVLSSGQVDNDNWWDRVYLTLPGSQFGRIITSVLSNQSGKPQLVARRAVIERSTDDGSTWPILVLGYLTGAKLADALVWDLQIGQPRRFEERAKIFTSHSTEFPNATPLLGGPLLEDFGGVKTRQRPLFEVTAKDATTVTYKFKRGFLPALYESAARNQGSKNHAVREVARRSYGYFVPSTAYSGRAGYFPRLDVNLYLVGTGALHTTKTPLAHARTGLGFLGAWLRGRDDLIVNRGFDIILDWPSSGSPTQPNVGTVHFLDIVPRDISPENPLHIVEHPVDIITKLWTAAGISYDSASAVTVKNALGPNLKVELRITSPPQWRSFVSSTLYGPFGFNERINDSGERELFTTRLSQTTLPSVTIDDADLRSQDSKFYELDEKSMINVLTWDGARFREYDVSTLNPDDYPQVPLDLVEVADDRIRVAYDEDGDGTPEEDLLGAHDHTYTLPGNVRLLPIAGPHVLRLAWVSALAEEIFERFGNANALYELACLDGVTAQIGDLVKVDVSAIPGTDAIQVPASQRGFIRVAQVLRRTEGGAGPVLLASDAGPAVVSGLLPTFTIAASSHTPKKIATITITNPTALGAGVVRIQWADSASPAGGVLLDVIDPGSVTTLDTPPADAGSVIAARMRSEIPNQQPGAWTAWQNVDLADLTAPSSLTAPVTGTVAAMAWTNGEANEPIVVLWRETGSTLWIREIVLPAGSVNYDLDLQDASTSYDVGVMHEEAPPFAGQSAITSTAISSGSASALSAPTNPQAYAGSIDPTTGLIVIDGTYGLRVSGSEFPSEVEFEVALETAVGSGTPGTYSLVDTATTVSGGPTVFVDVAPNDGLLRYIRARHVRPPATASGYTTAQSIDPWTATPPPIMSDADFVLMAASTALPNARVLAVADGVKLTDGGAGGNATIGLTVGGVDVDKLDATGQTIGEHLEVVSGPAVDFTSRRVLYPVVFDGGGSVLTVNDKIRIRARDAGTISKVSILADQTGSVVIDIWKDTHANAPPTVADTITASAKPTLSSAQKMEDSTLTGWTTAIAAGDWLIFNIDSVTTITELTIVLEVDLP